MCVYSERAHEHGDEWPYMAEGARNAVIFLFSPLHLYLYEGERSFDSCVLYEDIK